jgi:hypothetical protein
VPPSLEIRYRICANDAGSCRELRLGEVPFTTKLPENGTKLRAQRILAGLSAALTEFYNLILDHVCRGV